MKKYILSIGLIFLLSLDINAHVDHYAKYNFLEYELFRNNKLIGYHTYKFERDGNDLIIDNEVSFKITKLGVDLYKYYANGVEKYKNGVFSGFNSKKHVSISYCFLKKAFLIPSSIKSIFSRLLFSIKNNP